MPSLRRNSGIVLRLSVRRSKPATSPWPCYQGQGGVQQLEQTRLATARLADQIRKLPLGYLQVDPFQYPGGLLVNIDVFEPNYQMLHNFYNKLTVIRCFMVVDLLYICTSVRI